MRATVAFNRQISPAYLHLGIAAPAFPATFRAGEFVMIRPSWVGDPFLPRAFSIYRISTRPSGGASSAGDAPPVVEILYKILGRGTQCLSRMEPGQEIEILGPLGNSFTLPDDLGQAVLVAGGIGVPPIAALAAQVAQIRNSKFEIRNLDVFLGGKTSEDILCLKDFEEAGAGVHITTEDGSLGTRGLITDPLRPFLLTPHPSRLTLYTCGPPGMLAAVAGLAEESGIPCQASVEANMACGFGACMGCAVEVKGDGKSYKLVCKDGPVFDSREIVW
ncbi:MAG: dihydroorotate dehydrogenase electron transfer subunit [candidate division NC10 bacterium]|nr:dihydroorotate dehydrogenase electron transfer subunit [candidate division NC10 bacterium]